MAMLRAWFQRMQLHFLAEGLNLVTLVTQRMQQSLSVTQQLLTTSTTSSLGISFKAFTGLPSHLLYFSSYCETSYSQPQFLI